MERRENRALDAALEARMFWNGSRLERFQDASGSRVRVLPPANDDTFDKPTWKARRCIAAMLDSDLRFRIAKCRYQECPRPYFLLPCPRRRLYAHGLFCCRDHHNKASARQRAQTHRDNLNRRLIREAADFVRRKGQGATWSPKFKTEVVRAVNRLHPQRRAKLSWVTRHQVEIEKTAREMSATIMHR